MLNFKREPVAITVAIATLIDAIVAFAMAMNWLHPEVGGPIMTVVTAAVTVVRKFVSPVEKVAEMLEKPVEVVSGMLGRQA